MDLKSSNYLAQDSVSYTCITPDNDSFLKAFSSRDSAAFLDVLAKDV